VASTSARADDENFNPLWKVTAAPKLYAVVAVAGGQSRDAALAGGHELASICNRERVALIHELAYLRQVIEKSQ